MALAGNLRIADIKRAVADEFNVPVEALSAPAPTDKTGANPWPVSRARQAAIALSDQLTKHSRSRIGFFFGGRDHTTVLHACRAVESRWRADPELREKMQRVFAQIGGSAA